MWEAIKSVLVSANAYQVLTFILLLIWSISLLAKAGVLYFHNGFLSIGDGERERDLIKRQQEWAFNYIMALEKEFDYGNSEYERFFCTTILERVYDKVVEMIIFNHISERPEYIENKKSLIRSTVYSFPVKAIYRNKEFESKMDKWTEDIIHNLIIIRTLWGKEFRR